ncbi:MAG: FAD-binding oxidoreductase [Gammaproteobacteria bacterium]
MRAVSTCLPAGKILTDDESCAHYGRDWTRFIEPNAAAVLLPQTVEQVQAIARAAHDTGVPLVVSGGRTGLSGGAVAAGDEVVVSLEGMNRILSTNPVDRTICVEAGVITAQLQEAAESMGLFYPVDFASSGSSHIGGNIATNAGGIHVIRYGLTRDWVRGLKVVTAQGELLTLNNGLIKNATGYDLRHLFIGSEGSLGIIVEATMALASAPPPLQTQVVGLSKLADLMSVLVAFRESVTLSAFEFFSEAALGYVLSHSDVQRPFADATPYYALVEVEVPDDEAENRLFERFEHCVEQGWVLDGVISQSELQREALWALRERISECITPRTPYKNDVSVRIDQVPEFLAAVDEKVTAAYPEFEIVWYGHIGDGNLHLNILRPEAMPIAEFKVTLEQLGDVVYQVVGAFGGSVSAEHGVGMLKKTALRYSRSEAEVMLMQQIKYAFDPKGILNPGKIFDPLPPRTC